MKFISVDIECNQPSGNIIQIGAASFDTDSGVLSCFNCYIDPEEEVNWDHPLNNGMSLGELLGKGFRPEWAVSKVSSKKALLDFWAWVREQQGKRTIVQWGMGDMNTITLASFVENIRCDRFSTVDAKLIYKMMFQKALRLPKQSGLSSAADSLKVPIVGRAHDALVDAITAGRVYTKMFNILETYREASNLFPCDKRGI